jgi:predicted nicotinamide N-methyase
MDPARSTTVERVQLAGVEVVIERPADAEVLLDEEAFARDEFLPYWAELWPSAVALARRLGPNRCRGRSVLELGCGVGLPSVAAALHGGRVLATDWADEALCFVVRNAAANGVAVETALVPWSAASSAPIGSFDLVLGADLLYEARNVEPLLRTATVSCAPGGEVLIADPGRSHADRFLALAARNGWAHDALAAAEIPRGAVHRLWRDRR